MARINGANKLWHIFQRLVIEDGDGAKRQKLERPMHESSLLQKGTNSSEKRKKNRVVRECERAERGEHPGFDIIATKANVEERVSPVRAKKKKLFL